MTDEEIELLAYKAMQREDFRLAEQLFASLENENSGYALTSLGWMHENGYLGTSDKKRARTYFERAMATGDVDAHFQLALLQSNQGEFLEARATIARGMAFDDKECAEKLENLNSIVSDHLSRVYIENKKYKDAFSILKLKRPPESEYALLALGWLYHTGAAGIRDTDLARSYYKQAAELGSIEVHFQTGMLELNEKNIEAARTAFGEGAQLGHLPSVSKLGEMMIEGQGGAIEIEQGTKLLVSCATKGHILSKKILLDFDIRHASGVLRKMIKKMKYASILFDLIGQILKGSEPSNYYEFR